MMSDSESGAAVQDKKKGEKKNASDSAGRRAAWDSARAEILASVDVEAEYLAWGARICGEPNEDGWVKCSAIGRDDSNPSAGINIGDGPQRGRYRDFGSIGDDSSLSFFYAAARFGGYADHKDALKHYAEKVGVKLPSGDDPSDWSSQIEEIPWLDASAMMFAKSKPPIKPEAIVRMGAKRARWPKKSTEPQTVFVIPAYGPQLTNADPTGYVVVATSGRKLTLFQGDGKPPAYPKIHTLRGTKSGLMNRHALEQLADAEVIWKVEGVTDCLAVESIIPEDLRGKHVVVTNSGGATENPRPDFMRLFAGKTVHVLHDADKPGDTGAVIWSAALIESGASVRHVRLPYLIQDHHGLDVRDWLSENGGRNYQELLGLAGQFELVSKKSKSSVAGGNNGDETDIAERQFCDLIQLDILGEHENQAARVYSRYRKKVQVIKDISRLEVPRLIQICGPPAREYVSTKPADGQFDIGYAREAISMLAGKRRIEDDGMLGQGIWPLSEHALVVVNGGEASVWNGSKTLEPSDSPICRGKILDLSNTEPWVDLAVLQKYLDAARDPEFCSSVISEAGSILARWAWRYDDDPSIAVGLLMATFVQVFFPWRPQVAILGESGSGKTTLFEFIGHVFGKLVLRGEKPSEAGLRQQVGNSSKAILLDEFEADRNRQHVLDLIRTSSRGESSAILRGTQDQKGKRFSLRHICWVAAIEIGLKRDPDRNRFVQLELVKPPTDLQGKLSLPPQVECHDLGLKLMAVAIENVWKGVAMAAALRDRYGTVHDRIVESYSVPAAMLMASSGIGTEKAKGWLGSVLTKREFGDVGVSDQEELVDAIVSARVNIGQGRMATVGQILSGDVATEGVVAALEGHGVTRVSAHDGDRKRRDLVDWMALRNVFLCHPIVTVQLLRGTRWADQSIDQILLRVKGARRAIKKMNGKASRGIEMPIESLGVSNQE